MGNWVKRLFCRHDFAQVADVEDCWYSFYNRCTVAVLKCNRCGEWKVKETPKTFEIPEACSGQPVTRAVYDGE